MLTEKLYDWVHAILPQTDVNVELRENLVRVSSAEVTIELRPDRVEVYVDAVRNMRIGKEGFFISGKAVDAGYDRETGSAFRQSFYHRYGFTKYYTFLFRQRRRNEGDGVKITVELELEWLKNEFAEREQITAGFYEKDGIAQAEWVFVGNAFRLCSRLKKAITKALKER